MNIRKKITLSAVVILGLFSFVASQNQPFPVEQNFNNCIKPSNFTQKNLNTHIVPLYKSWKENYLRESKKTENGLYIYAQGTGGNQPKQITLSETHGYSMIIFALMAGLPTGFPYQGDGKEKECFDGLYYFFKSHPSRLGTGLMSWEIRYEDTEIGHANSASDGDMDIAYALLLAHYQWGSSGEIDYLGEATIVINAIADREINNNRIMFGDWWNEYTAYEYHYATRTSDLIPDHFRLFYDITNNDDWNSVTDECYNIISTIQTNNSPTTGLLPDFVDGATAVPVTGEYLETVNDGYYFYNACRFPLRLTADYAHYGTEKAKTALLKVLDWIVEETGGEPYENITAGYKLDGTPIDASYTQLVFEAPLICASVVDEKYQQFLDKGWNMLRNNDSPDDAYNASIQIMTMLLISGNWWSPRSTAIDAVGGGLGNTSMQFNLVKRNPKEVTYSLLLPKAGKVDVVIYSLQGRKIATLLSKNLSDGTHIFCNKLSLTGSGIIKITIDNKQLYTKFISL